MQLKRIAPLLGLLVISSTALLAIPAVAEDDPNSPAIKVRWEFEGKDKPMFGVTNGWKSLKVISGSFVGEVGKIDPFSMVYPSKTSCDDVPVLKFRLLCDGFKQMKFYFATGASPNLDEAKTVAIAVVDDMDWHEYSVDMFSNELWAGPLKILRFDPEPSDCVGATLELDYIRLCAAE